MAVLSLQEAAEQAGTSKVDIWRAVRSGLLPGQKTSDGGLAIDAIDLFRVFERRPQQVQNVQNPTPSPEAMAPPETATSDIAVAFAALETELKSLLGPLAEARANDRRRQDEERPEPDQVSLPTERRPGWLGRLVR